MKKLFLPTASLLVIMIAVWSIVTEANNGAFAGIEPSRLTAVGVLTSTERADAAGATVADYSVQPFGQAPQPAFTAYPFLTLPRPLVSGEVVPSAKLEAGKLLINVWDARTGKTATVHTLEADPSNQWEVSGLAVSPDEQTLYAVVSSIPKAIVDAVDRGQRPFDDLVRKTDIYAVSVPARTAELLYSQSQTLTLTLLHAGADALVMNAGKPEVDRVQLTIFDLEKRTFSQPETTTRALTALSPNGRYLAYSPALYSKDGDYDLRGVRILDLQQGKDVTPAFLAKMPDQAAAAGGWYQLVWGDDNRSLYVVHDSLVNGNDSWTVEKIDVGSARRYETVDAIPAFAAQPNLLGVFRETIYLVETSADGTTTQLRTYPDAAVEIDVPDWQIPILVVSRGA